MYTESGDCPTNIEIKNFLSTDSQNFLLLSRSEKIKINININNKETQTC